jgi:hypothetical protein
MGILVTTKPEDLMECSLDGRKSLVPLLRDKSINDRCSVARASSDLRMEIPIQSKLKRKAEAVLVASCSNIKANDYNVEVEYTRRNAGGKIN